MSPRELRVSRRTNPLPAFAALPLINDWHFSIDMTSAPQNPSAESRDARLQLVEERLSFQQKLIDDLNGEILRQQQEIVRLARDLHECRTALERLAAAGPAGEDLPYEKPPHY